MKKTNITNDNFGWVSILNFLMPIPLILLIFTLCETHQFKYKVKTNDGSIIFCDSIQLLDSATIIYTNTNGAKQKFIGDFEIDTIK